MAESERVFDAMAVVKGAKSAGKRFGRKEHARKQSRQSGPSSKAATRPSDVYEAEENDPEEERKAGQRYDVR